MTTHSLCDAHHNLALDLSLLDSVPAQLFQMSKNCQQRTAEGSLCESPFLQHAHISWLVYVCFTDSRLVAVYLRPSHVHL